MHSLYVVRDGALKTSTLRLDGFEQVIGFHFPGELIGLDALGLPLHRCDAVALIDSSVWEVLVPGLGNGNFECVRQQKQMLRMIGDGMTRDQDHVEMLVRKQPSERIALFLHCLFERILVIGEPGACVRLPMSRGDIASFLGLALETLSRTFAQLRDEGVIGLEGRQLEGLNRAELTRLATRGAAPLTLAAASLAALPVLADL